MGELTIERIKNGSPICLTTTALQFRLFSLNKNCIFYNFANMLTLYYNMYIFCNEPSEHSKNAFLLLRDGNYTENVIIIFFTVLFFLVCELKFTPITFMEFLGARA